ncbi:30S ribosomal protein S12 methylthiotransferase RimO [Desulforhopalus vacuolatus]|uniref:30S ribosomal protein S12 methylthiotransferase RimO n=1 Tax=Desulforhopalus vacuolatus TaxID=40414 RepID=UPI001965EF7F|nr:30S ribosomal protein S12 methylthiotransferase RimO [Desulforhopalus vacuolatus]MBM9518396.1 30S ribosomal protein S12 methylthiotransferase RimO [Desulforhopalus vacuolatus]
MEKSFHLVSLGCAKNLVDSEVMLGVLQQDGWTFVADPADATVLLVNTCGFIQPAVEEAIDEILGMVSLKEEDPQKKLVVTGCLTQRYKNDLETEIPEVDLFLGTEEPEKIAFHLNALFTGEKIPKVILHNRSLMSSRSPRQLTTVGMAWLKITEGCNNHCAYCKIPSIRGRLRSRTSEDIAVEAMHLEEQGVRELNIIAQDTTAYGNDLVGENIVGLMEKLLARTTLPWLRLLYLYPSGVSDALLDLLAGEKRIVPYLDVPFQHVSDNVLKRMNRHHTADDIEHLISRLHTRIPDIAIRTTFLVGFPGETEADFLQLEDFVQRHRLDHVGVFPYCNEEGIPAEHFADQVPEEERIRRQQHLLAVQSRISEENQRRYIGRVEPVLVSGFSKETDLLLEGRTRFQAPEVDGRVYINDGSATPGEIVQVRIEESHDYDLVGGILSTGE